MADEPTPTPAPTPAPAPVPTGGAPAPTPTPTPAPTPEPTPAPSATAWRDGLPDDLKPVAERFNTPADAIKAVADLRKRESTSVRVPGKDAKPEDVAAFRKALGVPDAPEGYKFPDLPAGVEMTDAIKAQRATWAKRFHDANLPASTAEALTRVLAEEGAASMKAQQDADAKYAADSKAALEKKWGPDFAANNAHSDRAIRAFAEKAGLNVDDLRTIETKGGTFLLDHPAVRQLFSAAGREMDEGSLGPALTDTQRSAIDGQLRQVRADIAAAQANRDSQLANRLYQTEQNLIAKQQGNRPVVGAQGRAA